ncbi:MAG: hypothetical protein WEC59_10825 [Salibacteraceae bacterium]
MNAQDTVQQIGFGSNYNYGIELTYSKPYFFDNQFGNWFPSPNGIRFNSRIGDSGLGISLSTDYYNIIYSKTSNTGNHFGETSKRQILLISGGIENNLVIKKNAILKAYLGSCFRLGSESIILSYSSDDSILRGFRLNDIGITIGLSTQHKITGRYYISTNLRFTGFPYLHTSEVVIASQVIRPSRFMLSVGVSFGALFGRRK